MWTGNTFSYLSEQRFLYFDELSGLNYIQYLLNLTQEHHLEDVEVSKYSTIKSSKAIF